MVNLEQKFWSKSWAQSPTTKLNKSTTKNALSKHSFPPKQAQHQHQQPTNTPALNHNEWKPPPQIHPHITTTKSTQCHNDNDLVRSGVRGSSKNNFARKRFCRLTVSSEFRVCQKTCFVKILFVRKPFRQKALSPEMGCQGGKNYCI